MANGAKMQNPGRSSFERVARTVGLLVLFLMVRSGILINRRKIDATAPMGKFI